MRTIGPTALLIGAVACHQGVQRQPGWQYRGPTNQQVARIDYVFDDPSVRFIGRCDDGPVFYLFGGDYASHAVQFGLIVDGKSWELPITYHEHGRFLRVDHPDVEAAIIHAKQSIILRVGGWQRQMAPSPLLRRFSADCR